LFCLPKHNYKLDNNLLTVEPRAVEPHCFDADPEPDPDPAQNLDADPEPEPDPGGEGVGQPKMCIPPLPRLVMRKLRKEEAVGNKKKNASLFTCDLIPGEAEGRQQETCKNFADTHKFLYMYVQGTGSALFLVLPF